MSISSILPASTAAATATGIDKSTIAGNFNTFLQLLTTQLKNQNPLDPLDTNQFTQQLVSFAQVEQQLKANEQLTALVALQQTAQTTQALTFVGATVSVDGATARLANHQAQWSFTVSKPSSATVVISDQSGQTAYTGTFTVQAGTQQFAWDGHGTDGRLWPDGDYRITVTAKDANGQNTGVSTEVSGVVDSVDLTQNPPLLSVGGNTYTVNQIKRVIRPGG